MSRSTGNQQCDSDNCESGLRNYYFEGKRLSVNSFRVEQQHSLERRRLLNRAIHGWGVVYGYAITVADTPGQLTIEPGLALDKCGRELLQAEAVTVGDDLILLGKDGRKLECTRAIAGAKASPGTAGDLSEPEWWVLSAHYAEYFSGPVDLEDPCHCGHREWDFVCETVRYSAQQIDCTRGCGNPECELNCDCRAHAADSAVNAEGQDKTAPPHRGGCDCLCRYVTTLQPDVECSAWSHIDDCRTRVRVDLNNRVPLACVQMVKDECSRWIIGKQIDVCGPRRLIKRNDLLFDLIRGCDLTTIARIGWGNWHRNEDDYKEGGVDFDAFAAAFGGPKSDKRKYVSEVFAVEFSRDVRKDTLRLDCFTMTVLVVERKDGWWQSLRVPIIGVDTSNYPARSADRDQYVCGAQLIFDARWVEDAVRGQYTIFDAMDARVEIEVRADFIIDCQGQAVDANAVGLAPSPSGNGAPGGTFVSTFHVKPKGDSKSAV